MGRPEALHKGNERQREALIRRTQDSIAARPVAGAAIQVVGGQEVAGHASFLQENEQLALAKAKKVTTDHWGSGLAGMSTHKPQS